MLLKPKTARNPTAQRILLYVFLWDLFILGMAGALEFTQVLSWLPAPLASLFGLDGLDGLIGWSLLVSLFCSGAACVMLGAKSKRLGWWLGGFGLMLLSADKLALLRERLEGLWSLNGLAGNPWGWALILSAAGGVLLALHSAWKSTQHTPGLRRSLLWAAAMWTVGYSLGASEAYLAASGANFGGLALDHVARLCDAPLGLMAALLFTYCVVSLIEYEERARRLTEHACLRPCANHQAPRKAA